MTYDWIIIAVIPDKAIFIIRHMSKNCACSLAKELCKESGSPKKMLPKPYIRQVRFSWIAL